MSLFDRIIGNAYSRISEGGIFTMTTPQARAMAPTATMLPRAGGKGYIEPMDNAPPGNMNPRSAVAAAGTRWQNKRQLRNRGDGANVTSTPPSQQASGGQPEPVLPSRPPLPLALPLRAARRG